MNKIQKNIRKNPDYIVATRFLNDNGLAWDVIKPNRVGHPCLLIEGKVKFTLSNSPKRGARMGNVLTRLKHTLRDRGILT